MLSFLLIKLHTLCYIQACIMAFFSKVVFAVFFSSGMLLAVAGTFFLADPIKQLKNIIEPQRIIAVIALVVSKISTVFVQANRLGLVTMTLVLTRYHV